LRQKCARRRHFSFLNTELDLGGLLELLEEIEVGVVNVDDSVDALANVDDSLEEDVCET
jgi:hypothetical protein